jgi:hypothetical protein
MSAPTQNSADFFYSRSTPSELGKSSHYCFLFMFNPFRIVRLKKDVDNGQGCCTRYCHLGQCHLPIDYQRYTFNSPQKRLLKLW